MEVYDTNRRTLEGDAAQQLCKVTGKDNGGNGDRYEAADNHGREHLAHEVTSFVRILCQGVAGALGDDCSEHKDGVGVRSGQRAGVQEAQSGEDNGNDQAPYDGRNRRNRLLDVAVIAEGIGLRSPAQTESMLWKGRRPIHR